MTLPTPDLRHALVASTAAPDIPKLPATISEWPMVPLLAKSERRRKSGATSFSSSMRHLASVCMIYSGLSLMSMTFSRPMNCWQSAKSIDSFFCWMVSVRLARMMLALTL